MDLAITGYSDDNLVVGYLVGDNGGSGDFLLNLGDNQGHGIQINGCLILTGGNLVAVVGTKPTERQLDAHLILTDQVVGLVSAQTINVDLAPVGTQHRGK